VNELFVFFVVATNPSGGCFGPVEDKVNEEVLEQMFGTITQAGRLKV
jgi:hypothetical protein